MIEFLLALGSPVFFNTCKGLKNRMLIATGAF
jgi:hypothetical protein